MPAADIDVTKFMTEHGFDHSTTASTPGTIVLFTKEPYAAAGFGKYATPRALAQLDPIIREVAKSWAPVGTGHYPVPYDKELWGFQVADLDYARTRRNTLVGDQPGLGKTQIAIAYANELQAKRVLCIVPASIRLQWITRIHEWTTLRFPYSVHAVMNSRNGVHPRSEWTVVSYDLARTEAIGRALAKGTYDLLILDEGHYLKSWDALRTRAVFDLGGSTKTPLPFEPLATCCERIMVLTGTPLPNRPREAYTITRALNWEAIDWLSEDDFRERFNPSKVMERFDKDEESGIITRKLYVDERSGRHSELQARLRANIMTRHLKREVMPQLKLPVYDLIQLEATGAIKLALDAETLLDIDPETLKGKDASFGGGSMSTARLEMGVAMAPAVADYLEMLVDGGETKLVVFAWHVEVLNILCERLQEYGVVRVDGNTGSARKAFRVEQFIKDPKIQFIIGNSLSLGTGTDGLQQVAFHALIAEPDWVAGNNIQCFDRLDRGLQERTVQGDIFVVEGSIAERILASALRKLQTTDKALDRQL